MSNPFNNDGFLSKKKQTQAFFSDMLNQWKDKIVESITGIGDSAPPSEVTLKDIVSYALDRQKEHPEIVSTRIAFFVQSSGAKVFAQTMINDKGETVFADAKKQNLVGRIFPKSTVVSQEITNLLADNVDCVIQLPKTEITFKEVLQWGQKAKDNNPRVSAVRLKYGMNDSLDQASYVITALDASGKEIYADPESKTVLGKSFPGNAKLDERLKALLEDDVTCTIPLE